MWTNACLSAIVCTNAKIPLADITAHAIHTLRWIRKIQRTVYVSTCISPIPDMLSYLYTDIFSSLLQCSMKTLGRLKLSEIVQKPLQCDASKALNNGNGDGINAQKSKQPNPPPPPKKKNLCFEHRVL